MTVPSGHPNSLVRQVQRPYHIASKADSADFVPSPPFTCEPSALRAPTPLPVRLSSWERRGTLGILVFS